ncbi:laminin subunit alpha-1-like [Acipenser ruthenus]|uniref:laminin subunit alpha-1-like n=1 Tax=Acipenser ruthenus TaxID=7906 RepID=UPI0027423E8C|nr:laminin subunit alpha-1-like [Acipenser ruthenus]
MKLVTNLEGKRREKGDSGWKRTITSICEKSFTVIFCESQTTPHAEGKMKIYLSLIVLMICASSVECNQRGLFPAILNLASNAEITANASCGETGPEMFCKLVEHVPGRPIRNPQCRVCDSTSPNPRERHPISNAIDGTNNWWQSPSIKNGRQNHWVTITLDLRQVFQVAYIIIKAANSPRPGNWILERSIDGIEFQPWQYHAISDTECLTRYNVTPRIGPPTYKRDDEVICTSYYSRLVPLEHGEIHTSLINGRPSADDLTPALLEFTSARYIRLRLQRIRTLNADLMTLSYRDPKDVDPIVTRRYYYSIKDISVGGMCICHGHAQSCPWDETTKKLQCVCEHNTCGESCNKCCPGYHQKPWKPGTLSVGNTCEKCNCHNKTEDCYYNQTVASSMMSMNIDGQFVGGGVCIDCTQNTAGINCETCVDGNYRPHKVSPYDENPCVECGCDLNGSQHPVCIKDDNHADLQNGLLPGKCHCKEGYAGEKCDRCSFGYSGYPYCVKCNCSLIGSIHFDPCVEQCTCKENVMGDNCDLCKRGYYNLQKSSPEGCTECFCFGVSDVCESISWPLTQVLNIDDWLMPVRPIPITSGTRFDHDDSNHISKESRILPPQSSWSAPESFLGNKLTAYGGYLNYTLSYDVPVESLHLQLMSNFDVVIEGNGKTLHTRFNAQLLLQPYKEQTVAVEMLPRNFMDFYTSRAIERDRLMTVLANLTRLQIRASFNNTSNAVLRLSSVSLDTATVNAIDLKPAMDVEHCECPWGYTGTSCESCSPGHYRVDGILFGGICRLCECNGHATECDIHGVCSDCKHNTIGPHCEQCMPGFYGDPSDGMPDDCQVCACPLNIPSNNFSSTCHLDSAGEVMCDQCVPGYEGPRCERCANGYYGDPTVPGELCVPCDCNGNVNPLEPGHCDTRTGECLKCVENTAGSHCERCADGYFGDAIVAKNCQDCGCHVNSSYSSVCDLESGKCKCRPNVTGEKCDQCMPGHFGLSSGLGCQTCNCNLAGSLSDTCDDEGQCPCVPGVAGEKCDRCARGFYDFQDDGCTPCDCAHTHNNCNTETGQCICPPHTAGVKCELCEANHWGHDSKLGCKPCDCSLVGSSSSQCDLSSGWCQCNSEFGAEKCNECALGFRAYPECTACNCSIIGTREEYCDEKQGVCGCDKDSSTCSCKVNVVGPGCDECKLGTFALSADDPLGCSPCFCFGVSETCEELGGLVRIPIILTPDQETLHVVSQSDLSGTLDGVFLQSPDILLDAALVKQSLHTEPFYWRLPEQFQGNKLLAYGGKLRYTAAFYALEGSGISNFEPQLLIKGGRTSKLNIYRDVPAPDNGVETSQEIDLKEREWKYFNSVSDQAVSHSDFMSVLSNIQYILIKASYGSDLQQSRISNISLEIAVDSDEMNAGRETARGIERCKCPSGYAGLSCQECAPGFYRQSLTELNVQGPRPLIEPCVSCQCNNHSQTCDLDTGKCQGCQDNTAGDHCDLCAPGYYGKVRGSISDCSLCACPQGNTNSFSPTCVLEGVDDFRCNACMPGYEGQYCERCSLGYYGNPNEPGGSCQLCKCNPTGSVHNLCDKLTGHCVCKPGVRGLLCDECEPRHILMGTECMSCNDNCTGVLLNDLENLELSMQSVNLTGVILAPYSLLASLENTTDEIKMFLSPERNSSFLLKKAEEQLSGLTKDIDQLHQKTTQAYGDGQDLNKSTERMVNQSQELLDSITKVQTAIQALVELGSNLNNTLGNNLVLTNSTQLLDEVSAVLEKMRNKAFTQQHQNATHEFKAAEALLLQVQREFQKPQKDVMELKERIVTILSEHSSKLQDAQNLVNESFTKANETNHILHAMSSNLAVFYDKKQNVSSNHFLTTEMIEEAQATMTEGLNIATDVVNATSQLEGHKDELALWNPKLRKQVDNLVMQMTKRSVLDLVYKAEDHAAGLKKLADSLHNVLSGVRNVSFNATNAAQANSNIKINIEKAERLAEQANSTVAAAWSLALFADHSLKDAGAKSLQQSSRLLSEAADLNNKTNGLISDLNGLKEQVDKIRYNAQNISKQLSEPLQLLSSIPNNVSVKVLEAKEHAMGANVSAVAALQHLEDFSQKLEESSSAMIRANETVKRTNELFSDSAKTANAAEKKVQEVETQTNLLFERLKPLKMLEDTLSRNLSEIKELIDQARKQAASIKVAVAAEQDCVRAYKPDISSSNYNTLTLIVKTSESDNLLFYLGSSTNVDFMALEMRRGKVSFLWDVGSGFAKLEYPDIQINNDKWHRIHATRFGKTGSLTVQELKSSQTPTVKTATSPGTSTVLDVNKSTLVFVGGLGGQIKKSSAVKMTHFKGCMGGASLNGNNIGLWNYAEREGKCRGCFMSPQDEDTSFHFDGSGYSVVEKALRSTVTQIVMLFKTFSPNGLLLYLASNGTRDFTSIELVDGKVRLTFELGSGPLSLITDKTYNSGNWYKIAFHRTKQKGYLAVMDAYIPTNRETKEGTTSGSASDLNRSDKDPIYIGGLPRSRPVRRQLVTRSYVGCIKNLEIARSNFDLLKESYGVKKGCVLEPIRSVTILNEGFLELHPMSLAPESELMATFSTKNDTGIILAGISKGGKRRRRQTHLPFFAVMLINGQVEVHINTGEKGHTRKAVVKSPAGTYSDGEDHSVILHRSKRLLTVQVDEGSLTEMRLAPSAESSPLNVSSFYIGGVPPGDGADMLKTGKSFYGCIRNMGYNMELLDLTTAVSYHNVDMDSCLLAERPKPVIQPEEGDLESELQPSPTPARPVSTIEQSSKTQGPAKCVEEEIPAIVPNAHQFGLTKTSHMVLSFDESTVRKKFSIQLTFRTFASDGLVYFMAHQNQVDYAALQLMEGHLYFIYDLGKGSARVTLPHVVNDGQWHTVKTDFAKKKATITVDGKESSPVEAVGEGNTLDVEGKLYLGGLPLDFTAKNIGNVTHSVPACINNVMLNNKPLDRDNPISVYAVNRCYETAQKGTHFDGTGFAALAKGYKVRSDLIISFEFRTPLQNGVLLGISSAKVDAVGLELVSGKILFHVNNGAGRITTTYSPSDSSSLCDGKWHKLQANKSKHWFSLTIDGQTVRANNPYPQSTSAETNNPIYVGGFPANVKQNCLTIKTPFQGCMRSLRLVKGQHSEAYDFSGAFELRGVFPNSCPGAQH